ncbi:exosortase A [Azohydromonas aeria]|uniref:exosortase A n=1 Tax=Azohydromonas aeria TaxID=2590212 RepID=UPI0012F71DBB|nr:exosortase A [Azohydromonas aeria]
MSSVAFPVPAAGRGWKPALAALALLWAALALAGHATLASMVEIWLRSETFAHAMVVPFVALWLAWRQRAQIAALTPRAAPALLPLLAAALLAWLLGVLAVANSVAQLALVTALVLAVPLVLGLHVARRLLFPLGFLFFMVPLGEFMMPQLMAWTADFTVWALHLTGIPVMRDGLQFVIPSGSWSVEAACSGLRYLIASFMVGVLFAYLNYRSPLRRAMFVAASLVVPILANWVRAYIIVMLGHLSGNAIATGADHLVYGWVFFGFVIMVLFAVGMRWSESAAVAGPAGAGEAPTAAPAAQRTIWLAALAAAALALAGQGWLAHLRATAQQGGAPQLQALLAPAAGWQPAPQPLTGWRHGFVNAAAQFEAGYVRGAQQAGVVVAYYARQDQDSKLVSSLHRLASVSRDGPRWIAGATERREVVLDGQTVPVRSNELRAVFTPGSPPTEEIIVWQLYWVNGELTSSDLRAKALGVWSLLLGRGDDAAAILVYAPRLPSGDAQATLRDFTHDHLGKLLQRLQQVREARQKSANNDNRAY